MGGAPATFVLDSSPLRESIRVTKDPVYVQAEELQGLEDILQKVTCRGAREWVGGWGKRPFHFLFYFIFNTHTHNI